MGYFSSTAPGGPCYSSTPLRSQGHWGPGWEAVLFGSLSPTEPVVAEALTLVFTYICWWHQPSSLTARDFVIHHRMELLYMQSSVYLSQLRERADKEEITGPEIDLI